MRLKTSRHIVVKMPLQPLKVFFIGALIYRGINLNMGRPQNKVSLSDPAEIEN